MYIASLCVYDYCSGCRGTTAYCSLEKELDKRPSPEQIMAHPWVVGMQRLTVDMERWIKEAWGWP